MLHGDYYTLLGIPRCASDESIKQAYRKLVRQWHPDLHPDLPDAEERLKRLNEAYHVLRDHHSKAIYDRMLFATLSSRHAHGGVPVTISPVGRRGKTHRRRSYTPLVAACIAVLTLFLLGLSAMDNGRLPYELQDHGYLPSLTVAQHVQLTSAQQEAECLQAADYWQREVTMTPGGALARYNLAAVYSQVAFLAEQRGDSDLAKHYGDSARALLEEATSVEAAEDHLTQS